MGSVGRGHRDHAPNLGGAREAEVRGVGVGAELRRPERQGPQAGGTLGGNRLGRCVCWSLWPQGSQALGSGQRLPQRPSMRPLRSHKHRTLHPAGAWGSGVALLCLPAGGLTFVHHVGLGAVGPGCDTFQGLDEVVLVGEPEHTFLWRSSGSRGESRPWQLFPSPHSRLAADAPGLCSLCALCLECPCPHAAKGFGLKLLSTHPPAPHPVRRVRVRSGPNGATRCLPRGPRQPCWPGSQESPPEVLTVSRTCSSPAPGPARGGKATLQRKRSSAAF